MLEISEILTLVDLKNSTIRERAHRAHISRSKEFLVTKDGEEAGFLSYEDWGHKEPGFIQEIFVLPDFRRKGIAKHLLMHAENYALQLGCQSVRLKPYTLNLEFDQNHLIAWYTKEGYKHLPGDHEHMTKLLYF